MAANALAQEKVWVDKSAYDRAECLHQEKLAKVQTPKIMDNIKVIPNPPNEIQGVTNTNSTTKSKSKKVKDNKLAGQDNASNETAKSLKNSKKNKKKEEHTTESSKVTEAVPDSNGLKTGDSDTPSTTVGTKKSKAKEAKEKKNKADKKHRNLDDDKVSNQDSKEQLSNQGSQSSVCPAGGGLASEVAKARQHIKQSLQCMDGIAALAGITDSDLVSRVASLEKENQDLRNIVQELKTVVTKLDSRVKDIESNQGKKVESAPHGIQICPQKPEKEAAKDEEDDDVDLFGSDSEGEDAEAAKIREERLAAYAAKKSKKPALIAKSNIILDIKPWDDETDMKAMEAEVRKITTDGLLWGAAKLAPVAYNIQKLQISCVVEDDKVSIDWLTEQIQDIEDFVQSVDIAAFNKI